MCATFSNMRPGVKTEVQNALLNDFLKKHCIFPKSLFIAFNKYFSDVVNVSKC